MSRQRPLLASSLALSLALLAAAPALAQPAVPEPVATDPAGAEVLFQKARPLMEQGDLAAACPLFEESYRLDPAPGTLLNIAACSRLAGKTATAWGQFLEASRAFQRKGDARRAKFAEEQAAEIVPLLAQVIVKVEAVVPGLVVRRDGVALTTASLGTELPVDPGEHTLRAEAPGYEPIELKVSATARATTEWSLPALVPAPPAADSASEDPGRAQRIAGFTLGGTGAAALVAGLAFVGLTASASSDLEALCPEQRCATQEGADQLDQAKSYALAADILLIAGGAIAATGLVVALTAPSADAKAVSVQLQPGPLGLIVSGRF